MISLEEWLSKNISLINLSTTRFTAMQDFVPNLHDFATTIIYNNKEFNGRGSKYSEDIAIKVSLIEALERLFVRHNHLATTNGVAAHTDKAQAEVNAKFELIERDLFISHLLTRTPFSPLQSLDAIPVGAIEFIHNGSDSVNTYKMRQTNQGTGIVCVISGGDRWGGIFGLSFGNGDQSTLIRSSFVEAFRQYLYFRTFNELQQSISLDSFLKLDTVSFQSHSLLSRNVDYFKEISSIYLQDQIKNDRLIIYDDNEFSFKKLNVNNEPFNTLPIHVIQCTNPNCQDLYIGPMSKDLVSRDGIRRFLGFETQQLNMNPHPLY